MERGPRKAVRTRAGVGAGPECAGGEAGGPPGCQVAAMTSAGRVRRVIRVGSRVAAKVSTPTEPITAR
ncbi:hypothetical protein GCM10018790_68320 [Kitasatospora xanthocidica]|nr:hypothetical protein GCM10018790_68320 [Kitasatospora xanthocidica]